MALLGEPSSRIRAFLFCALLYIAWTGASLRRLHRPSFAGSNCFEDADDAAGTRCCVLKRSARTGGAFTTVEVLIRPGAPGFYENKPGSAPLHSHPHGETLAVRRGTLGYVIGEGAMGGAGKRAGAGETVHIPGGEPHAFFNPSANESLLVEVISAPAPPLGEGYWESLLGLSRSYGGSVRSVPPLQMVLLLRDAGAELRGGPAAFQFASNKVLPHVARALGEIGGGVPRGGEGWLVVVVVGLLWLAAVVFLFAKASYIFLRKRQECPQTHQTLLPIQTKQNKTKQTKIKQNYSKIRVPRHLSRIRLGRRATRQERLGPPPRAARGGARPRRALRGRCWLAGMS